MKWCMINEKAIPNAAIEWLQQQNPTARQGASHDGVNRLYVDLPPADLLAGLEIQLVYNTTLAETDAPAALLGLIAQAASFMLGDTPNVLTGERWMWDAMFRTPQHRIWINKYDDEQALFEADFLEVFGQAAGTITAAQASSMIKAYFGG